MLSWIIILFLIWAIWKGIKFAREQARLRKLMEEAIAIGAGVAIRK